MFRVSLKESVQNMLIEERQRALPLFAGLCFFLSLIDILLPKPMPFFRLGLANLALMLAMDVLSVRSFFLLLLVKVLGQAVLSGTLFSYILLFSLLGTFSSGIVMYLTNYLRKIRIISFVGISMLGALASNLSQIFLARFVVFGEGAYLVLPLLLLVSLVTSFILGVFANNFYVSSLWYEGLLTGEIGIKPTNVEKIDKDIKNLYRIVVGVFLIMLLMFIDLMIIKAVVFFVAIILCVIERIEINIPRLFLSFLCIITINLFQPYGYVIFEYRIFNVVPIIITQEALFLGILKALLFEGLLYISKWMLKAHFTFKGAIGRIVNNSIFVFECLLSCKKEIKIHNLTGTLDSVLLSLDKIM